MIPDFISARYLWIAGKMAQWRSWLVPTYLLATLIAFSALFILVTKDGSEPPPSPVLVIGYEAEIEALKARASTAEANQLALINAINKIVEIVNRIKSPNLGNLATKNELEQARLEVKALKKELTNIADICGYYQTTLDSELDKMRLSIKELKEALTAHTDNTTIHKENGGN